MTEKPKLYEFYFFSFYLLIISAAACVAMWAILLFIPQVLNISLFFFIYSVVFLICGLFMFSVGAIQTKRKNLDLKEQMDFNVEAVERSKAFKFLIFAAFFGFLIGLPVLIGMSMLDVMNGIVDYWYLYMGVWGIAIGVFLISIFGNFTVVFPVPYAAALVAIGLNTALNPIPDFIIFALMAGLGASIGELSAWLLGRSQADTVEDSDGAEQFAKLKEQIDKGYGGLLVFAYAATPLPDDVLLMALGASKYNPLKLILWCFLGKLVLCSLCLFGAGLLGNFLGGENANPLTETLWMVIGIGVILAIIYIDWDAILKRD